jgi:GntR family transcriptional regulator, transcriptional repressor for pyruvate dehydrogenase complex
MNPRAREVGAAGAILTLDWSFAHRRDWDGPSSLRASPTPTTPTTLAPRLDPRATRRRRPPRRCSRRPRGGVPTRTTASVAGPWNSRPDRAGSPPKITSERSNARTYCPNFWRASEHATLLPMADPESATNLAGDSFESVLLAPLRTTSEQIADRLIVALSLGEYLPGERLPTERELSEMLDVSRRSVRLALHRLEEENYIEIRKGRSGGAFVRSSWGRLSLSAVPQTQLDDIFEMLRIVEPMIARKAAERRTQRHLGVIRAAVEAYRSAEAPDEIRKANAGVHEAIAAAAHHPLLASLSRTLRAQVSVGCDPAHWTAEVRDEAIAHHDAFVRAFEERRPRVAARVALEQVKLTERALRQTSSNGVGQMPSPDVRGNGEQRRRSSPATAA